MSGLNYELIECNIRILNVKIAKVHITGEKLLLSKPSIFMPNKRKKWYDELEEIFAEEFKLHSELLEQYKELEKLMEKH